MGTQIHPVRWLLSSFHPETPFFSSPAKGEGVSGWKLSNRVNADLQDFKKRILSREISHAPPGGVAPANG